MEEVPQNVREDWLARRSHFYQLIHSSHSTLFCLFITMAEITKNNKEKSADSKVVEVEKKEEVKEEEYIPTIEEGQSNPT